MIEKNNENSPKSNSSKLLEEDEIEIPNFKLLYRNTPNSEGDKSSGVSSDEEATSSSLVPLPNTLKQMRNKSKWTLSEVRKQPELNSANDSKILGKSADDLMNSLEELRKKYTLKNEISVTMKMNSANLMLDDILSGANLNKISNECPQSKEQETRPKIVSENESSTTDSIVSHSQSCTHFLDHSHAPMALNFLSHPCHIHCNRAQPLVTSSSPIGKDLFISKINPEDHRRKKTLMEKFQDLQIRCRIQSVYKILQKNPFSKSKKESHNVQTQQGIPGSAFQENSDTESRTVCKCQHYKCPFSQYPKKMILDLIECSEMSQCEKKSPKRENCTCTTQKECDCPEVMPKCFCTQQTCETSEITETPKQNSLHCECLNKITENSQASQPVPSKEDESCLLLQKENECNRKEKTNSLLRNNKGWKKYCSKEKNLIERTDIYYFDHGNSEYYQTTDIHPLRYTECLVERTDEYATKFWAEIFGTIEIGVAFLISFILQLYRFLFTSIIRSLSVGLIQIISDYFFKPVLTILFNGIIQPCLILAYNIATSIRDLCLPISQIFGFFAKEIANIFRSCRIIEINRDRQFSCNCGNKV